MNDQRANYVEYHKDDDGKIVASLRSEAERDLSAHIDPVEAIQQIAEAAGLQVTISGNATNG